METKVLKTRILLKHDSEENWLKTTGFIPLAGEMIIYDADETYDYERIKIGNGIDNVNSLVFVNEEITESKIDEICSSTIT